MLKDEGAQALLLLAISLHSARVLINSPQDATWFEGNHGLATVCGCPPRRAIP